MEVSVNGLPATTLSREGFMEYSYRIENSIDNIPSSLWNSHIPIDNPLMQYDYLKLLETTHKSTLGFRYVLVIKGDLIQGVLYFQIIHYAGKDLLNYFPSQLTGWKKYAVFLLKGILSPFIYGIRADMLVSGNIFMTGESGIYFQPGIKPGTQAALLRNAINEIRNSSAQIKAAVVSDLYEPKTAFCTDFPASGYHEVTLEPDMSVGVRTEWKDFNDYLNALSSKYRVRAKRVLSINNEHQIIQRNLAEAEVEKYQDQLYHLYMEVMDNARFKLGIISKDYFRMQKRQMPENYFLFAYFRDEELLGFISAFLIPGKMHVHYCGVNAAENKDTHLYQRMMYDMLDIGIRYKVRLIHFGRTAPEIKSTIGATPSSTFAYIKHFNQFINSLVIRNAVSYMKPKNYVFRNPFKL